MSRTLFPKISTYKQEWLAVGDGHEIYLEQTGNPDGIPVIYLHGGPGGGSSENHRRYFDPEKYRIILFDQRGCGRSRPSPSIENNTTWKLIEDIEFIRQYLGIKQWLVTGGSWGTTLALVYGISHPERILGFILRGIFLGTECEYNWLYQDEGACRFFPEYYADFITHLPQKFRQYPLAGYHQVLNDSNEVAMLAASKAWYLWELRLSTIEHNHIGMSQVQDAHQALCMAKISSHYFVNNCFFDDNYILNNIEKIADIPAILIHGRYDMVCQLHIADSLVRRWHNAQLQILPIAGHSGFESQTIDAICKATDTMANFLNEAEQ
ncbi:prolyl aminopeptidase [Colwelliaceae bacterium 6471]